MNACEWCGEEHEQTALCAGRPKWSRRGFLALFGAGIAGAALAHVLPALPAPPIFVGEPGAMFVGESTSFVAHRKIYSRIRLTPEALVAIATAEPGAFMRAAREEERLLLEDVARRENFRIRKDGKP